MLLAHALFQTSRVFLSHTHVDPVCAQVKIMERIEVAHAEATCMHPSERDADLGSLLIALLEVDPASDNLKRAAEKRKNDWLFLSRNY